MSIWAIADLHLSRRDPETGRPSKPMELFGPQWENHLGRLETAWYAQVDPEDTVIVAGDIDWALRLEEAMETLSRVASWPGATILLRGNHDYWWSSKSTSRVRRNLPKSMVALHNVALQREGFNICGAKGSPVAGGPDWSAHDTKLLNRERLRLKVSLAARDLALPTIVALHYPPFYPSSEESGYRHILDEAEVECVVYGHLHGEAAAVGPSGRYGRTEYRLVAADAVDFRPVLLATDGALAWDQWTGKQAPMTGERRPLDDVAHLADEEMSDKRRELGGTRQTPERYDVPAESNRDLTEEKGHDESED